MLETILRNLNGIILGLDVGTYLGSLYVFLHRYNDSNLEGLLLGYSLVYTDHEVLGSDEGVKLGISDGKLLVTIFGNVY